MKKIAISISALSNEPSQDHLRRATKLVEATMDALHKLNCTPVFYIGGYKGLMRYAVDTILRIDPTTTIVAILPVEYENMKHPSQVIAVKTGMSFQNRNPILVRSGDILVALGGGSGTIMEVFNAIALGKTVVMLTDTGTPSDFIEKSFPEGHPDPYRTGKMVYVDPDNSDASQTLRNILSKTCS